jgi:hypothetical protein
VAPPIQTAPTPEELDAAFCLEASDVVPKRPAMTAFRQRTRLHHARWRETRGHPIGTMPFVPQPARAARPLGNRLPLDYGRERGATFVTPGALSAARHRTSFVEHDQSIDQQGLWADLLSSDALAFNLFGDLATDKRLADRQIHTWWPDVPGRVSEVRFLHSPGRLDGQWLNSLRDFHAAFILDLEGGTHGVVAVSVKHHERLTRETPKPSTRRRRAEVHERSGAFQPTAFDQLDGRTDLWEPWLEQLLMFSMLQHPSGEWTWGRYVVVHPTGNVDMADMCRRYRELLADEGSFDSLTLEAALERSVLPAASRRAIGDRYLVAPAEATRKGV